MDLRQTEVKDILHLYIGSCDYMFIGEDRPFIKKGTIKRLSDYFRAVSDTENFKLILRPLSDMTEGECIVMDTKLWEYASKYKCYSPEQFAYLLKQGFDLFNLIESGQAIDKTKL